MSEGAREALLAAFNFLAICGDKHGFRPASP
jgi:hypothetical protein